MKEAQQEEGLILGAKTSITSSGGRSLLIETTALSTLAWLRQPSQYALDARKAIQYILSLRDNQAALGILKRPS